jgi:hypothetical protein
MLRYAYVEFSTIEAKENAKLLNDSIFKGKQIKVEEKRKNIPDYYGHKSKKILKYFFNFSHFSKKFETASLHK